jgi:hypothetical protein
MRWVPNTLVSYMGQGPTRAFVTMAMQQLWA